MRKRGWLWTEEYCWHKKNCYPGKWPNRFRDAWERCLQFTKQRNFAMYQEAVMVPVGDWADTRLRNLSDTDKRRDESKVASGFGKNISNWLGRALVYPTNVLHLATECGNKAHSAVFPVAAPAWFIKLFTAPGDVVLDPFMGSGSAAVAAKQLGRQYVGIELSDEYVRVAEERLEQTTLMENGNGPYRQGDFAQLCQREDCTVPSGEAGSPEKDEPGGGAEEKEPLLVPRQESLFGE